MCLEKKWSSRVLKKNCQAIGNYFLWNQEIELEKEVVYLCRFSGWIALLMRQYSSEIVEVIQKVPKSDCYFYQTPSNPFKKLSIWCIKNKHSEELIKSLKEITKIEEKAIEDVDD